MYEHSSCAGSCVAECFESEHVSYRIKSKSLTTGLRALLEVMFILETLVNHISRDCICRWPLKLEDYGTVVHI